MNVKRERSAIVSRHLQISQTPPELVFKPTLANYANVFGAQDFLTYMRNSALIAGGSTLFALALGLPAAYSIARFRQRTLSTAILVARIVPGITFLIPWFILFLLGSFAYNLRKDAQKYSWKWLIVEGSLLILLITSTLPSAVSGFSGGKAWLGTIYLAIALLFGLLAVTAFVRAWRIWRRRREKPHESIA